MSELGEILVTPEYLKQRAEEMNKRLKKALEGYQEMIELIKETENCFMGKSAEKMKKKISEAAEKGTGQIGILCGFSVKLSLIAEEYEAAERKNKDASGRN